MVTNIFSIFTRIQQSIRFFISRLFIAYINIPIKLLIVISSLILASCTGHYEAEDFDLVKLKEDSIILLQAAPLDGEISAQWWSPEIVKIKPKEIRKEKEGIYIVLDSFLGGESGLFIPSDNQDTSAAVSDTSIYILLGHDIYSYHIEG